MNEKTNVEVRDAKAPLFGIQRDDIVGYVVFILGTDRQYQLLSNGNQEQVEAAVKQMWTVVTGKREDALGTESTDVSPPGA